MSDSWEVLISNLTDQRLVFLMDILLIISLDQETQTHVKKLVDLEYTKRNKK